MITVSSFIISTERVEASELVREAKDRPVIVTEILSQVTATDGDKDRPENIVYFLTGQGIDTDRPDQSKFDINKTTGEIFVLKVETVSCCNNVSPIQHDDSLLSSPTFKHHYLGCK